MTGLHRAAWPALGAAILFGASTPFAKQLIGDGAGLSFPFLLAGLLLIESYLFSSWVSYSPDCVLKTVNNKRVLFIKKLRIYV